MAVSVVLKSVFDDKGIKNATRAFTNLGTTVGRLGKTLLAGASFAVITRQLTEASKAAIEDAKSQALLATQLRNTVGANDALIASVESSINQMTLSAGVADDVLRPAFAQLVRATGDVAEANTMLQLALDVSAGTGRDLQAVSIALSRAYQGNTASLSRLGIKVEDGADAFAMLQEQFAGAAETAAQADPFQRISVIVGELSEQLGVVLIPYINQFANYLASSDFSKAFTDLVTAVGMVIDELNNLSRAIFGTDALTFLINLVQNVAAGFSQVLFVATDVAKLISEIFAGKWGEAGNRIGTFFSRFDKFGADYRRKLEANRQAIQSFTASAIVPTTIGSTGKSTTKATETQFQKVQKIVKDYQNKLLDAEQDYTRTKLEINRDYQDSLIDLEKDYISRRDDIIESSINRLREAFRSATAASLGDLFGTKTVTELETSVKKLTDRLTVTVTKETERTVGGTVTDLIASLSSRLAASRDLLTNASQLASKGFSQTFIEQVVETGTDTGNALATAILGSSAEQQAALKKNFLELESVSETGMDAVAKGIYDKMGLATRELKAQNAAVNAELADALKTQYEQLQRALADAGYAFTLNVNGIKDEFTSVIDELDGKFGGLGKTIDQLLAKMGQLSGVGITDIQKALIDPKSGTQLAGATIQADVAAKNIGTAAGLVIDSAADVAGSMAYIQARIAAANTYIQSSSSNAAQEASARAQIATFQSELANLKAASASETGAAGTVININVKTDTTQSAAMVGKTIGGIVTKYTTTGGKVLVSGQ